MEKRRHEPKKKPERYETVRAFGLSIYVASLSSVSRYLCSSLSHGHETAVNHNRIQEIPSRQAR